MKNLSLKLTLCATVLLLPGSVHAGFMENVKSKLPVIKLDDKQTRDAKRQTEIEETSKAFAWWPTDAEPKPFKDPERGGYWWYPNKPGQVNKDLWGNRGYIYVYKIIYDYKEKETVKEAAPPPPPPPPAPKVETRDSLLIKKIIRNIKIYFDYNKADLRDDHIPILERAVKTLGKNPEASILITGNCDVRGSDEYNLKLGLLRGDAVKNYMLENGVAEDRVKIISRGKLDAVAPLKDLEGMQKDRNAQFVIAEVEEVKLPANQVPEKNAKLKIIKENTYLIEEENEVESAVQVSTREYTIQEGDSLWKIAQREIGNGNRWDFLYELNQDRIKDPNKLKAGTVILIPVE